MYRRFVVAEFEYCRPGEAAHGQRQVVDIVVVLSELEVLAKQGRVPGIHQRTRNGPSADLDCRIAALPAQYCTVQEFDDSLLSRSRIESFQPIDKDLGEIAHIVDEDILHRALHRVADRVVQRWHEQHVNQQQHEHESPGDCIQVSCHSSLIVLTPCADSASRPHRYVIAHSSLPSASETRAVSSISASRGVPYFSVSDNRRRS